jgi:hypothetical protein
VDGVGSDVVGVAGHQEWWGRHSACPDLFRLALSVPTK